jgi:hypothetical protein
MTSFKANSNSKTNQGRGADAGTNATLNHVKGVAIMAKDAVFVINFRDVMSKRLVSESCVYSRMKKKWKCKD